MRGKAAPRPRPAKAPPPTGFSGRTVMQSFHLLPYLPDRVDLPCPRGWWGNPVCGPCHCAVSKGFDPDCNKTNGQCQCKVRPGPQVASRDAPPPAPGVLSLGRWPTCTHMHTRLPAHTWTQSHTCPEPRDISAHTDVG